MPDTIDADSLINSAIEARSQREARLQNIDAQSHAIGQQLRNTNRRDRGRIAELQSQQRGLEQARTGIRAEQHSDEAMTNLRVQSQFRNAHLSEKTLDDQRHEETARQVTNINNGLARLEAKYPNRGFDAGQSQKFQDEVQQLGAQNEMGQLNARARDRLSQAATFHDQVRQKTLANAAKKLSDLTKGGLSPEEFANRDYIKDFTTNATDLASALSKDIAVSKRPKDGEPLGVNTVFQAGNANWMLPTTSFSHFDSNFKLQPTAQTVPVTPVTPDQNSGIQPLVPTYGGQGAAPPGGLVRNYDGSITPIVPTYGGEGAAPPGALVRTGVAQIGTPTPTGVPKEEQIIQSGTATVPPGVQPNQPLQPVTQLGTQPMDNAPQVAQQPSATPQPIAAQQPVPTSQGDIPTIRTVKEYNDYHSGPYFDVNGNKRIKQPPITQTE